MMNTIFITGIGTDVGKTITAAILTEALEADYWKPVQAGYDETTDSEFIQAIINNKKTIVHPETYKLKLAASPHIAAREEGIKIGPDKIYDDYLRIVNRQSSILSNSSNSEPGTPNAAFKTQTLIIEGAGGLMVPLNEDEFVVDLIRKLNAKVILVSRNYLGSINHSLLTAAVCKEYGLQVSGWIFNDHYMNYETEIVEWSGYSKIASIPFTKNINTAFICEQATIIKSSVQSAIL